MSHNWGTPNYPESVTYSSVTDDAAETWSDTTGNIDTFNAASIQTDFALTAKTFSPYADSSASTNFNVLSWPDGPRSIDTMASHLRILYSSVSDDINVAFQLHVDDVATWWVTEDNAPPLHNTPFRVPQL